LSFNDECFISRKTIVIDYHLNSRERSIIDIRLTETSIDITIKYIVIVVTSIVMSIVHNTTSSDRSFVNRLNYSLDIVAKSSCNIIIILTIHISAHSTTLVYMHTI